MQIFNRRYRGYNVVAICHHGIWSFWMASDDVPKVVAYAANDHVKNYFLSLAICDNK